MIVACADWSVDARKRWIAIARRGGRGWGVRAPRPAGDATALLASLHAEAAGAPVALGLDVPLGLPRAYVERHACHVAEDFPGFLRRLTEQPEFFRPAASIDEAGPERPFYPARWLPGLTPGRRAHIGALGLDSVADWLRACDRATATRPAAAPLFWTLGAKQVGKAALHAWEHVVLPGLAREPPLRIWPFEGALLSLLIPGELVVCETYPAEALRQLRLSLKSKRRQSDRAGLAAPVNAAMSALDAVPEAALAAQIANGFGSDTAGEDRFDSVIGLLGMLNVLGGRAPDAAPAQSWIARWEGWILGQAASAAGGI